MNGYDPFISAKRQLKELCSPTLSTKSLIEKPATLQKSVRKSNVAPIALNTSFRRTNSVRSPRKLVSLPSRPFISPHNYRQTVQRGLSDEGPISTSFLKTEEFDEMPVRSVCQNDFAVTNTTRMIKRDCSLLSRNMSASSKYDTGLDSQSDTLSPEITSTINNTVSSYIFRKQEEESKASESSFSTKDLKDKSNALSKRNLTCTPLSYLHSVRLEPIEKSLINGALRHAASTTSFSKFDNIGNIVSIDPKLVNICDNLSIETKLSDVDIKSESSTHTINKYRNSANLRKRKIILDRNNFLFDALPNTNNISFESTGKLIDLPKTPQLEDFNVHEFFSSFGSDERDLPIFKDCQDFFSRHINKNKLMNSNIGSFTSCSTDSINNTKEEVNATLDYDFKCALEKKEKGQIFICIETDQSENDSGHPAKDNPLADNPTTQLIDISDNLFSKIEEKDEEVKRNNEQNQEEADIYHSEVNLSNKNIHKKRSSDSGYGR